jgi:hypothetical protein
VKTEKKSATMQAPIYNVAHMLRLLTGCGDVKLQRLLRELPASKLVRTPEPCASADVLLELLTSLAIRRRSKGLGKRDVRPCRRRGKKIVLVDAVAKFRRCSTREADRLLQSLPEWHSLERVRGLAICSLPTLRQILPRLPPLPQLESRGPPEGTPQGTPQGTPPDVAKQLQILNLCQKQQQEQIQALLHTEGNTLGKQTVRELWEHKFQRRWRANCEICGLGSLTPISVQLVVNTLFAEYHRLYAPDNVRLCCSRCAKHNKTNARALRWDNRRALVWLLSCDQQYEAPCFCCQRATLNYFGAWHMGHLLAAAQGGVSEPHNLRAVCAECNATMRTQCMQDFMRARAISPLTNRPTLGVADALLKSLRV